MKRFLMISTAAVVALACCGVAFGQPTITGGLTFQSILVHESQAAFTSAICSPYN